MHFTIYFLALFLVPAFAVPPPEKPPPFKEGEIVGVRPGEYETKPKKYWKDVTIHPGVVLGSPNPETGKFPVAMISTKLPNNPPQEPIKSFYHGSDLRGNIRLDPPKNIENAKPWKNEKTGGRQSPMSHADIQKLREAMVPHQGWRSPPLPASPPLGKHQNPQQGQRPPQINAHASSSRPQLRQRPLSPQQANAYASGSRIPLPVGQHPPHVNAHASSSRLPVAAVPQWRQRPLSPQQVNAHASGSRIPLPVGQHPPHVNAHASTSRPPPVPARGPHNQGAPWRKPNPPPAAHRNQMRPDVQGPRPQGTAPQRNPAPASLPRRPASPAGRGPTPPPRPTGKQPMRGKREFIRRRAVRSEH